MLLEDLRIEVCRINRLLPVAGLVTVHSGNASGIARDKGLIVIKPSGVDYDMLKPEMLPVVDLEGQLVEGTLKPSVDLPHHLYLYRELSGVGGVIHTHSNYATAFAAAGLPIPACLTAVADEFGGEIPCMPYADNIDNHIGETIVKYRRKGCPAILMGNHGVFTFDASPAKALKAAIMTEDAAQTVWLALQIGAPAELSPEEIAKWYGRYHSTYGQK